MVKKILGYFIAALCGALLCGISVYGITKNDYHRQADKLSADIARLEATDRQRVAAIESLTANCRSANARADKLETELRERDRRFAAGLAEVRSRLSRAATALEGSDGGIDAVIEGLGQVKELIKALP